MLRREEPRGLCVFFLLISHVASALPSQLSSTTLCSSSSTNLLDLSSVQRGALLPDRYNKMGGNAYYIPVYANRALSYMSGPDSKTESAYILIHGTGGSANNMFCNGVRTTEAGTPDITTLPSSSTLYIAPWFGNVQLDASSEWWLASEGKSAISGKASSVYWASSAGNGDWNEGGDSNPTTVTTSFDVMDSIVTLLGNTTQYPNLRSIVISGFSAGGQFVQRWAMLTTSLQGSVLKSNPRVYVRSIAGSPSSWLWPDSTRPNPSCTPLLDTGVNQTCAAFAVPTGTCDGHSYDKYKYGLASLSKDNQYVAGLAACTASQITGQFLVRDFRVTVGDQDVCDCNTAGYNNPAASCTVANASSVCQPSLFTDCCDTNDQTTKLANVLDVSCAAGLQGSNRLQRALNYRAYMMFLYPSANFPQLGTFSGNHAPTLMFRSAAFQAMYNDAFVNSSYVSAFCSWSPSASSSSSLPSSPLLLLVLVVLLLQY